ncbi:MAG: polyphosphate kinase 1 [Hydrogenophaga sp.]|uniref:polyphosphate kinase 1 n=1 Tax=Hydrogenophaga sp. TaxID=1904254 RepID=UPI0016961DDA|nr:polyphosphate kinase 1 [Hydrogenophaga sp.]NIM41056.1 polyphosphate kinase 1 [Hydrogenophaga sp.]NIN25602.1 polyphosphate kinase 1 [Hydrogenophaga sp.]NIN30254.1 polyphosphate kinase 1 [Hydrogenophaga sp.]NIN54565.1 polyphosphate kinase 1 [Hydrogenophaga sp.]NIO50438.1 polyphosphate kinase 1 [Hydrogenophaga sp.]
MTGQPTAPRFSLLDRDHSILAFNERVMDWARRPDVPELERLRYLSIVSSNLDEFFEVRMAPQLAAAKAHETRGLYTVQTFEALSAEVHQLVAQQYAIYNDELLPALEKKGIKIVAHSERNARQRRHVREIFHNEVQPLLMPVGLDPAHPFPQVANKSLNFIVRLTGKDAFGRENEIAIVKVPRILPRFFRLPSVKGSRQIHFVSISSLIRTHLNELFPGRQVTEFSQFRVTRHSDLAVDEEEVKNLRTALRKGLQQRHYGQALRLEVSAGASTFLSDFLLEQFGLPPACLYRVPGPVNLVRLNQLIDKVDAPELRFEPYLPGWPQQLTPGQSFFERLQQGDVLIHQPYESFDAVLSFLREAVEDPDVLAIKQTIYRTGAKSELMDLLREAVRRGKEVTAVVELKARFDEEANINYAERLESVGAQVVYGVVGLKTHAKMLLITRREPAGLRRYAHLSTGNYNPGTARVYTDLSYLTADESLTADVDQVFLHLASQNRLAKLNKALIAPFLLHKAMLDKVAAAGEAAARGQDARITLKMNALTDEPLARALAAASQQGVKIDLIVRGACVLPAGVPGFTDNVRVRSVIGRLLEHSRVYHFRVNGDEEIWLSSADWMNRNMLRRVELAWPVTDPSLRQRIVDECLNAYLHDTRDAWLLQPDGHYVPAASGRHRNHLQSAQAGLMARHGGKG